MLHKDFIEVENHLAYAMLQEAAANQDVKKVLKKISSVLLEKVLNPLREKLNAAEKFSDLTPAYQALLQNLAAEHTAERRQYGAVMPEVASSQDILASINNLHSLLDVQEKALRNIDAVNFVEEMAVVLKIIVELGYTHYEAPQNVHNANFDKIKDLIASTTEEIDIRLFRKELGEAPKLALSFGIGTTENDLGLESLGVGRNTGKSVFGMVSMETRLKYLYSKYDETPANHPDKAKYAAKLTYYKIPLNKDEREPLEVYANRWETFFEKQVKEYATKEKSLPLIASVSRATSRIIVTLQDLGAFNKSDGSFDFDKAQMFANCIMAFLVHAGHHSIAEVAEVYNRLLDYVAIESLEKSGPTPEMVEEEMPYYHYRIGNYHSFFHGSYVNEVEAEDALRPKI